MRLLENILSDLTFVVWQRSLEPEEALVHVDGDLALLDEAEDEVVGEPGVGRLHLVQGRPQGLRGARVALLKLEEKDSETTVNEIVKHFRFNKGKNAG